MARRFSWLLAAVALVSLGEFAQATEDPIAANIPEDGDFRATLLHDLKGYFEPVYGRNFTVDYELLRDEPTQTGTAYPKFYLWVSGFQPDKTPYEGAVRVVAIKKHFEVTTFIPRADVIARPEVLPSVFPQVVIAKIRSKIAPQ